MKAVLSNRIYLKAEEDLIIELDKQLTYKIPSYRPTDPPSIIKNLGIIRKDVVSIPIGCQHLIPSNYTIEDKRVLVPVEFPEPLYPLYESQQLIYDAVEDNCIINAPVSWGKTFTALWIAYKLKQRTLIVTHTTNLRDQWGDEVRKLFGFDPDIIGSGKFGVSTPVVVGNIQTLYRTIPQISRNFGLIELDEMHHVSSPTFNRIIDKSLARYKIGLTGTLERKDGKHVVFRDYFGTTVFTPDKENYMEPKVEVIKSEVRFMDGSSIPWANRVNDLAFNEEYIHSVALIAAAYAAKGHKILLVSDRVKFLKTVAELIGEEAVSITGDDPREIRKQAANDIASGKKKVLCGTQAIFSEGISIKELSCLILGTPINNRPLLTQLIGRIIRKCPNKPQPVIIDINLKGNTARRQANSRMMHYMSEGYHIKVI